MVQFPGAGGKQPAKLIDLFLDQLHARTSLFGRDALGAVRVDGRLDPADHQQRVQPVGDHHDRKTGGDANHVLQHEGIRGQGSGIGGAGDFDLPTGSSSTAPIPDSLTPDR